MDNNQQTFLFNRILHASTSTVFEAWTNPELLAKWWGPKGFTNPVCQLELRRGGAIRIDMRGPDGKVYPMFGKVEQWKAPMELVFTSIAKGDDEEVLLEVLNSLVLSEHNASTKLSLDARVIFASESARDSISGMEDGWNESLDKLTDLVENHL